MILICSQESIHWTYDWIDGGRTRIRTRVAGLEGQSDIQLHYTSNQPEKYLFHELWVWDIKVDERICDNEMVS